MNTLVLAQNGMLTFAIVAVIVIVGLVVFALCARLISLWIQCWACKANIRMVDLIFMGFRKVNPSVIVRAKIIAVQAGLTDSYQISTRDLESHYLAGGNVPNVIRALVAANRAKIDLDWQTAQAIDLAGRQFSVCQVNLVRIAIEDADSPTITG